MRFDTVPYLSPISSRSTCRSISHSIGVSVVVESSEKTIMFIEKSNHSLLEINAKGAYLLTIKNSDFKQENCYISVQITKKKKKILHHLKLCWCDGATRLYVHNRVLNSFVSIFSFFYFILFVAKPRLEARPLRYRDHSV